MIVIVAVAHELIYLNLAMGHQIYPYSLLADFILQVLGMSIKR